MYGEELGQTTAIWWSPDSTKVGYYRFDESPVKDFYLQMTQTSVQSTMDVEAYPKAGAPNPIAEVFVYDVAKGTRTKIDVRDGKPFTDIPADGSKFTNDIVGHYAYNVRWSPDGSELLLNRTNRRQNIMELAGCSPATGECRVIVREEWLPSWTNNRPQQTPLADHKRFIWQSERNGFANYYLGDLSGRRSIPSRATRRSRSGPIVKVDEAAGVLFYMARSGDNFMKMQLHRVGLDGRGDVRLTDPKFNHSVAGCGGAAGGGRAGGPGGPGAGEAACGISPDNKFFVDVYQTHNQPPATQVRGHDRQSRRPGGEERHDEVREARPEEGRDVHLPGGRRQDDALRDHFLPVEFRSVEEIPGAGLGLRRPRIGGDERKLHGAERHRRIWLPDAAAELAFGAGPGQGACSISRT